MRLWCSPLLAPMILLSVALPPCDCCICPIQMYYTLYWSHTTVVFAPYKCTVGVLVLYNQKSAICPNIMDNLFDCIHSRLQVKFLGFDVPASRLATALPAQLNPGFNKFAPLQIFSWCSFLYLVYLSTFS